MKWRAKWVYYPFNRNPRNSYVFMRKTFVLNGAPSRARVCVSADSRYKLYVNGTYVGRGPARCDPRWQYYDEYDVAHLLRSGRNVFAALVHHYGEGTGAYILGRAGFLLQADVRDGAGKLVKVDTDASWKCLAPECWQSDVHRISHHQGFREVYDARKEIKGWNRLGCDDSEWRYAAEIGVPPVAPWAGMVRRDIPQMRETEVRPAKLVAFGTIRISRRKLAELAGQDRLEEIMLTAKHVPATSKSELKESVPAYFLYDFGREITGYHRISLDAPEGVVIDIGSDELLKNGRLFPRRLDNLETPRYVDRYITKRGRQTWTNSFSWKGLRYMEVLVHNYSRRVKNLAVSAVHTTYPVEYRGDFECSDALLNDIWKMCRYTVECCMHDGYVDNAYREQQQYAGDGRPACMFTYYAFGDYLLPKKLIRQISQSQGPRGDVQSAYPWTWHQVIADYCAAWVGTLRDYYTVTADAPFVGEMFPTVEGVMKWYELYLDEEGLLADIPDWTFIDWADMDGRGWNFRGRSAALNLIYYGGLLDAAFLAALSGREDRRKRYLRRAARLKRAIHEHFWDAERGVYVDANRKGKRSPSVSEPVNALAILHGVARREDVEGIVRRIFEAPRDVATPSPFFYYYVLRALFRCGRGDLALRIIRTKWAPMLDCGNGACWETFDTVEKMDQNLRALCQLYCASPLYDMLAEVIGVKPSSPGFATFEVEPTPVDLSWASGKVPTPKGTIQVRWERKKEAFSVHVTVPKGCRADVLPPAGVEVGNNVTVDGNRTARRFPLKLSAGEHIVVFSLS